MPVPAEHTPRTTGRPPKRAEERRTEVAAIRLTPAERADIEANAAKAGKSLSDYMRMSARLNWNANAFRVAPSRAADPATRHELAAIGNNLNQLARKSNMTGGIDPVRLNDALTQLRAVLDTFSAPGK